jgi:hypothetical protein
MIAQISVPHENLVALNAIWKYAVKTHYNTDDPVDPDKIMIEEDSKLGVVALHCQLGEGNSEHEELRATFRPFNDSGGAFEIEFELRDTMGSLRNLSKIEGQLVRGKMPGDYELTILGDEVKSR